MAKNSRFSFGRNWKQYLGTLDEERFREAELSLTAFMGLKTLKGLTFLDIGCGSGLFSHAAFALGAEQVVSVDVDPVSIECCRYLHDKAGRPENWEVREGSIVDTRFVSGLSSFDIVYSWGVLHHTGNMWEAVRNAANLVKQGGFFYISIYNKTDGVLGSKMWLSVKKFYNRSPYPIKRGIEAIFIAAWFVYYVARLENPVAAIRNYKSRRGMSWRTDIIDWLGGYPYEFATVEEIFRFMRAGFSEFRLVNIKTTNSLATNWFLFEKGERIRGDRKS
jgi:2-polyprenyl-6-hydroxyphenyl methylase/3-demethylubiquinone-9 3-methyltransferase